MSAMASTLQARPFVGVAASKRVSSARPRAVAVRALAREDALKEAVGAVAGAALAASIFVSPALAFEFPGLPSKQPAENTGTLPEGDTASSVQKRVTAADSMRGGGAPDESNTAYPETSGGSGEGNVPPVAGRSNLTSTAAAPDKAQ